MEKIRYLFDWRVLLLGAGFLSIAFIVAILSNPSHPQIWEFIVIVSLFLLFLVLNFTYGTYGLLDKKKHTFSRTDYFCYTKRLNVKDIEAIYYRYTWVFGGPWRSLYIIGSADGKEKIIDFPNVEWRERILAQIAIDLRSLNSSIKFDSHTEALMKKYEKNS